MSLTYLWFLHRAPTDPGSTWGHEETQMLRGHCTTSMCCKILHQEWVKAKYNKCYELITFHGEVDKRCELKKKIHDEKCSIQSTFPHIYITFGPDLWEETPKYASVHRNDNHLKRFNLIARRRHWPEETLNQGADKDTAELNFWLGEFCGMSEWENNLINSPHSTQPHLIWVVFQHLPDNIVRD